jgi:hypothetical protein
MFFSAWSKTAKIVGATSALALTAVPVAVLADASNPVYVPKKKAKPKPRKAAPKPRRAAAKPVAQPAPVEATVYTRHRHRRLLPFTRRRRRQRLLLRHLPPLRSPSRVAMVCCLACWVPPPPLERFWRCRVGTIRRLAPDGSVVFANHRRRDPLRFAPFVFREWDVQNSASTSFLKASAR